MQLTMKARGEHVEVLSYLLAKNPYNLYERTVNGHRVRMIFRHFTKENVEVTIFVTPDPIELSRENAQAYDITSYINDREFAVSSIFLTLLRSALGTALNGKPKEEYEDWVEHVFNLEFEFGPVASNLGDKQIHKLFEPLGYQVEMTSPELGTLRRFKEKSTARMISIKGQTTLQRGLRQLYVLIPVLDNYKHYFIDEKEVDKINRYGEGWLKQHPERAFILEKALRYKAVYEQLQLSGQEPQSESTEPIITPKAEDKKGSLNQLRYEKIIDYVKRISRKASIVDFGSGEGKLSVKLGFVQGVQEIFAVEPSEQATSQALRRFEKVSDREGFLMPTPLRSSLYYFDERLKNKDIMILCEVIEHIDEYRLPKMMNTIISHYQPKSFIITTPNQEYNQVYDLGEGYRHPDHRFEWTREQFKDWCHLHNDGKYELQFDGIGEWHELYGYPTQLCLWTRKEGV